MSLQELSETRREERRKLRTAQEQGGAEKIKMVHGQPRLTESMKVEVNKHMRKAGKMGDPKWEIISFYGGKMLDQAAGLQYPEYVEASLAVCATSDEARELAQAIQLGGCENSETHEWPCTLQVVEFGAHHNVPAALKTGSEVRVVDDAVNEFMQQDIMAGRLADAQMQALEDAARAAARKKMSEKQKENEPEETPGKEKELAHPNESENE